MCSGHLLITRVTSVMNSVTEPGRWLDYVLKDGEGFKSFWQSFLNCKPRDLLFVVGGGFDPRMLEAVKTILSVGGTGRRHCVLVEYDERVASSARHYDEVADANKRVIEDLFGGHSRLKQKQVRMWSDDGRRRVGSRGATEVFASTDDLEPYTDVLVDISALPRSLYIPMLAKLLYLVDQMIDMEQPNLHVLVGDNPALDQLITTEGLSDEANYLHGFESGIEQDATADAPKVWMPILGEGKSRHFERIYDLVVPDEIAPVIPFPCAHPRRTDDLILEYRALLFDQLRIEPSNFIFAPEQNPFAVYRVILSAIEGYTASLEPLGQCKVVISALSSKLLSLGALLAAYDLKKANYPVGIAHVHASGYAMSSETLPHPSAGTLYEVWIAGEPYDSS